MRIAPVRTAPLGALALLVSSCSAAPSPEGSGGSPVTPPASEHQSEPGATPTATAPVLGPLEFTWTEQPVEGEVQAVAADGDRFVAVGTNAAGQVSWTSTDGAAWAEHAVPPPLGIVDPSSGIPPEQAAHGSQMGPMTRLEDTLYSFGVFNLLDFVRPVGWRWTDGGQWESIVSSSEFYERGRVRSVVAADGAIVAARTEVSLSFVASDTTIWVWRPDTSWVESDFAASNEARTFVTEVAWHDGLYLAAGVSWTDDESASDVRSRAWSSGDGLSWTELDPPTPDGQVCALSPDPAGGFTAIGFQTGSSIAWAWRDGAWDGGAPLPGAAAAPSTGGEPFIGLCELTHVGGRTMAVIGFESGTQGWSSAEGGGWQAVEELPAGTAVSLDARDRTLVVVTSGFDAQQGTTTTIHAGTAAP